MEEAMQLEPEMAKPAPKPPKAPVAVSPASFEEIQKAEPAKQSLDLDFVLDIPLVPERGAGAQTAMLISELLQLGQGSVVELTKLAGEPMDVYVNQRLIAAGKWWWSTKSSGSA
jgi:flagellar motor switch protein FliN/FliY